jgi:hypothetical protein
MGSAVIFPLQTIIYSCLAIAAVLRSQRASDRFSSDAIENAARRVRVFGDDIIIPKYAYGYMLKLLHWVGLKVNDTKTFSGGNFRESCGVDAFRGVDVTPAYLVRAPERVGESDVGSFIEVSNNFWKQGYWHTATWLDSFTSRWNHLIPVIDDDLSGEGRFSFTGPQITHLRKRWDPVTQQEQVRVVGFIVRTRRTRGSPRQDLHQWFIESPRPDLPWEAGADSANKVEIFRPGWQSKDKFVPKRNFGKRTKL